MFLYNYFVLYIGKVQAPSHCEDSKVAFNISAAMDSEVIECSPGANHSTVASLDRATDNVSTQSKCIK